MKTFFITLFVFISLTSHSQQLDYTRKYLKTIVRRQMVEIDQLLAENSKLKKAEESRIQDISKKEEQNKLDCNKAVEDLRIELRFKENEIKELVQEKESAQVALRQSKRVTELLSNKIADMQMATPQYSSQNYVLPEPISEHKPARRSYSAQRTTYITGPRGGCYYINGNGNKTYVDRSLCR